MEPEFASEDFLFLLSGVVVDISHFPARLPLTPKLLQS